MTLSAGASPGQVTINGNLTLDSDDTMPIEINGTNAASQYDNFIVNGTVTLGSATLSLSGTHNPATGDTFTIISNDSTDAVSGTFAGLAEGAIISNFLGSGAKAQITYAGGSNSNDVVITVLAPDVSVTVSPDSVAEDGATNLDFTFTRSGNISGTDDERHDGTAYQMTLAQPLPFLGATVRARYLKASEHFFNPFGGTVTPGSRRGETAR